MTETVFRATRMGAATLLAVALALLVAGCGGGGGGGGQQEDEAPEKPVAGSFVGEIPNIAEGDVDNDAFVAVVATSAQEGVREVRAYLCSGGAINEWFMGSAEGNKLDLTSEGGAQLEANLTPETATGTITLDDGTSSTFKADLAKGIAGLYNVDLLGDGRVIGTSETGNQLEGEVADEQGENGLYPITGNISVPDGQTQNIEAFAAGTEPAETRWVVLPNGQIKGGKTKGTGAGFSLWIID
jgi:hypothetical protein